MRVKAVNLTAKVNMAPIYTMGSRDPWKWSIGKAEGVGALKLIGEEKLKVGDKLVLEIPVVVTNEAVYSDESNNEWTTSLSFDVASPTIRKA